MSGETTVVLAIVVVLVVALLIGMRVWRRDPLLRVVRFGVFLERERFDDEQLDEDDVDDDPTSSWSQRYPSD